VLQEEKLLEATLSTYTPELRRKFNLEVIVSDGGSTDGTISIAHRHADAVVMHDMSHRQTIAEGRNCGAERANGEVLVFINGDTVPAHPEKFFAKISEFARREGKYKRASALACPVKSNPEECTNADLVFHSINNGYVRLLNVLRIGAGRGESQVVRTDVFKQVGGYRPSLAAGEDFDLFGRIGLVARVRYARELLVFESPRRFRKFGYLRVLFWWTTNALSVLFRGRSSSDEWEPVR